MRVMNSIDVSKGVIDFNVPKLFSLWHISLKIFAIRIFKFIKFFDFSLSKFLHNDQQNFAHDTKDMLLWHVKKFVAISNSN